MRSARGQRLLQVDEKGHHTSYSLNTLQIASDRVHSLHTQNSCGFHGLPSVCSSDRVHTWAPSHYAVRLSDTCVSDGTRKSDLSFVVSVCKAADIGNAVAMAPSTWITDFNCLRSSGGRFLAISSKDAWGVGWYKGFSLFSGFVSCF